MVPPGALHGATQRGGHARWPRRRSVRGDPQRCGPVDENHGENAGKNMKKKTRKNRKHMGKTWEKLEKHWKNWENTGIAGKNTGKTWGKMGEFFNL